jgi:glycosyltransferase involved in cell wall biosynthesis
VSRRIVYDGLNLALTHGTGIATYARVLSHVAQELGHEVGIVYSSRRAPPKALLPREIAFFDAPKAVKISPLKRVSDQLVDHFAYWRSVKPKPIELSGAVVTKEFAGMLPAYNQLYAARNLFQNAERHFALTNKFVDLSLDIRPDVFHCTYQLPLKIKSSCNIYTIHDLIPLRLPFTTLDNKRYMLRLLRKIAREADHIVTVSEHSKRDIIEILNVEEKRVTNTYQGVILPERFRERSDDEVADELEGSHSLEMYGYLLFFGAFEPKKNIIRLVDAYLASNADIPLVIVAEEGWQADAEQKLVTHLLAAERLRAVPRRRIQRLDYVTLGTLITLIRGARAVLFPSLYEGFGLPILEAMSLGTPVITSTESSVPEVAGDAALLVDPYDTTAITRAINTVVADADLRAELSRRGRIQAENFSMERYRERVERLYATLG